MLDKAIASGPVHKYVSSTASLVGCDIKHCVWNIVIRRSYLAHLRGVKELELRLCSVIREILFFLFYAPVFVIFFSSSTGRGWREGRDRTTELRVMAARMGLVANFD